MNNPTESKPHQQHVYDSSLKALFQDQTQEMLSLFAGDVTFVESLDGEAIKLATLRTDRCFRVTSRQGSKTVSEVVHLELQTGADSEIVSRMLEYFGILYRKFQVTIRPVVVYLFHAELPEPQLIIVHEDETILTFKIRVVALWQFEAQTFVEQHNVGVYALLPTMAGATSTLLSQALDEMKQWYHDQPGRLASHLLWFGTFLQRTTMVSPEDKERIGRKMEEMDSLISLLDENPFVQRKKLEGRQEGLQEGRQEGLQEGRQEGLQEGLQEGRLMGLQEGRQEGQQEGRQKGLQEGRQAAVDAIQAAVVAVVGGRFPPLMELAEQRISRINRPDQLSILLKQVAIAPNEEIARFLLDSLAA